MVPIGTGSGIKVKPTAGITQYIQGIDVCSTIKYDTLTVYAWPLGTTSPTLPKEGLLSVFPNPASNSIEVLNANVGDKIEVYNLMGQMSSEPQPQPFSYRRREYRYKQFAKWHLLCKSRFAKC